MSARICVTFNDNENIIFPDGLRGSEIAQVSNWTKGRIASKSGFFEALGNEDNDALRALRLLGLRRNGDTSTRFDAVEVEFDSYDAYFIDDTGREIEPHLVRDEDGDVEMKLLPDGSLRPKTHKNDDGSDAWIYTDSRERVPVPPSARRRPGRTTSAATPDIPF